MKKICLQLLLLAIIAFKCFSQNVDYSTPLYTNQSFTKTVNPALPVGSIAASGDVTAAGAATYSIPIMASPGTNGVVPSISIEYQSSSGNGSIGKGWNISGLSAISRSGQTMYHNGQVTPVDLSNKDRFIWDGQMLIGVSGVYGANGATYGLESENFSKVTSNGINGTGPTWFKVVTKEGVEMEFGNTVDSRMMDESNVNVLFWRINRIKNPDGNYIEFKYLVNDRDSRIDEINYTGNTATGLLPYNKIKFQYKIRADINNQYIAASLVANKYLLDKITVTAEGSTVRSYDFKYSWDKINSYLRDMTESGSDGSSLNATIFKYGDTPKDYTNTTTTIPSANNIESFSGDYDGDGLDDILTGTYTTSNGIRFYSQFKVFKRTAGNENYTLLSITALPASYSLVKVGRSGPYESKNANNLLQDDFNGDGLADVMSLNISIAANDLFLDNIAIYKSTNAGTSFTPQAKSISLNSGKKINANGNYFHPGDFNGDGILEYITILGNAANVYTPMLHTDFTSAVAPAAISISGPSSIALNAWVNAKVSVLDFNGDGKSDLLLCTAATSEIYTFTSSVATRIYSGNFPNDQQNVLLGDFNGDGKTDVLAQSGKTVIRGFSTGSAFVNANVPLNELASNSPCPGARQFYVGDFNGDGKSDFAHDWFLASEFPINAAPSEDPNLKSYLLYTGLNVFYSQGNSFLKKEIYLTEQSLNGPCSGAVNDLRKYVQADLNGDGRTDLIYNSINTVITSSFNSDGKENLLHKAANGMGHITEWNYKKLPDGDSFYTKGPALSYPVNNIQPPVYAVSELKTKNGIGGISTIQYAYEDARLHRAGKGYLGFRKVTTTDLVMDSKTISESEFNNTYFIAAGQKTSSYLASTNALLSQSTVANEFVNLGSKRFLHRIKSVTTNNAFEGRMRIYTNNAFDNYGNVTQNTVNNDNVETTVTTNVYGAYPGQIPNKATSVTITKTRSGQSPYAVTTALGYNALGQLNSKTDFSGLPKSVLTTFEYYPLGNLKKTIVTPSGLAARSSSAIYDIKGRYATFTTNELNQTTSATYDTKWGKPLSVTGIDGLITTFEYDAFARDKKTTYPEGFDVTQTYGWDMSGNAIWYSKTTHPGKPDVKSWYDLLGRQIKTETEGFQGQTITQETTYDARGNLYTSTNPYKNGEAVMTSANEYDAYNRIFHICSDGPFGATNVGYAYAGGKLTTVTTTPNGTSSKVTDASGQVTSATDDGGTLDYTYYSHGGLKAVSNGAAELSSSVYDAYGKQTSLTDLNAGTTTYDYNALGQLASQTNANNKTHTMLYDLLGRNTSRTGPEGTTTYEYYPSGNAASTNRFKKVTGFAGNLEEYTYDAFGRLKITKQTIDASAYTTTYGYNIYGDLTSLLYPSGFGTNHAYDAAGYPTTIKNSNNVVTIYTNTGMNGYGQNTAYSLGNTKSSTVSYNYGIPTKFTTAGIQNFELIWDYAKGNLSKRKDLIKNNEESFTYDNLDRLLSATVLGKAAQTVTYQPSGNISSKSDAGQSFSYHPTKINALAGIVSPTAAIPVLTQDITYTAFNQPEKLTENGSGQPYELTYTYGADYERIKGVMKKSNALINTHYYFGNNYEKDVTPGLADKHLHYIYSPAGMIAIVIRENNADQYYYTYTDHLGSLLTTTAPNGAVLLDQNFDAWGRLRNPTDWTFTNVPNPTSYLYRGFTGHEHLTNFNLVNINGRMYDPVVGRVLSVDNYVQNPFGTQDYNRYSYAKNNPLVYTDPDGQWIHIVIGAAIGGAVNLGLKALQGKIHNFKDGAVAFGIGAAAGAITAATGGAATSALNLSAASFSGGAVAGSAGAATGGLVQGLGNAAYFHDSYSFKEWAIGVGIGGLTGGITGGLGAPKGKFWHGQRPSGSGGELTFVNAELPDGEVVNSFGGAKAGDVVAQGGNAVNLGTPVLEGALKSNYGRFISKIPANSKASSSFQLLDDGNYLFQAISPGKVPGSSALYQKWVNPLGETLKMMKTTFAPDGSIIHIKPK
ncbi:FG-GAP-like repeat-containing protein [Dyadobacter chenwenxiniae]|uniref:FG-GAP-like repeat-containing protein n=1 Tax=Dyadobacter chenwenxiniae TaxID=2906456 RepID=A0A9X1PPK3_9BACT|nr:FG-GAP-like repeat-containing protein [Dyadobacter chenwenxiniae]MCF0064084.1 FG-GAP-like repeat-containing protein [Dyadobacter chenwenxiniae]UON82812.1 FG-GAP-like repeat-containing protein [Dyadobacter chenwenxiniae]